MSERITNDEDCEGILAPVNRRRFLVSSALAGSGLILGCVFRPNRVLAEGEQDEKKDVALNAWLRIAPDNSVTIMVSQAEMGQGIQTTLPAVLADELGADWRRVKLENAPADPAYRNPRLNWQFTGNSESTTSFFDLMRQMGAAARAMLVAAAADRWRVEPTTCRTENSKVLHTPTGRSFAFGELAEEAAKKEPPAKPTLKPEKEWQLVGKALPRVENAGKVDGSAVFGMDFQVPRMVYAAVRTSPVFGGKVAKVDKASVQGLPGVIDVVPVPNGVALVAKSYWQAQRALDALQVTFEDGPNATLSSASLKAQYRAALDGKSWVTPHATGDKAETLGRYRRLTETPPRTAGDKDAIAKEFATIFSEEYESQFLAHATMEPMNCTAHVTADGCDIWAPTQGQEMTQLVVSELLKLPKAKVRVNRTLLGGGFGRRLVADFAVQAVLVSKAVGLPVKVIWSREEDIQHDIYRPAVLHRITAGIDEFGRLQAVAHKVVSPSILQFVYPMAVTDTYDPSCLEGLLETRYKIPNTRVDFKLLKVGVPTSVMRTTGYGPNIFAYESFIDELAQRKGQDPYLYRRDLLTGDERAQRVLDLVAEKSDWKRPAKPGQHRGIAFCEAFKTILAHVIEISMPEKRAVKIHRVVSVVDPGTVLDPGISANSIEGGVAWGLSCAFQSEITFEKGRAVESNWHDYKVIRMPDMPPVEVHFVNSGARPLGGVGEVGPTTVLPALTNAIFAATGQRVRSLPLSRHGFRIA